MTDAHLTMTRELFLTTDEAEQWDWAAHPCIEFFAPDSPDRDDDERRVYDSAVTTTIEAGRLETTEGKKPLFRVNIVNDPDVAEDMIYRLGTQLPDMFHQADVGRIDAKGRGDAERMKALRDIAAAKRVVGKLKLIFGIED